MEERNAIVTGAGTGIGRGVAIELGKAGYNVVLHCNNSEDGAISACNLISSMGRKAKVIKADLTKKREIDNLFYESLQFLGSLSLFVNNAGVTSKSPFSETDEDFFDTLIRLDFKSAYFCVQSAANIMAAQGTGGNIVIISSINAFQQRPNVSVYGSIKAALLNMGKHAAIEYAKDRIRVNMIAPGWVETPRICAQTKKENTLWEVPLKKWVQPEEIGGIVLFYASEAASSITGNCIIVDNGQMLLCDKSEKYGL